MLFSPSPKFTQHLADFSVTKLRKNPAFQQSRDENIVLFISNFCAAAVYSLAVLQFTGDTDG